MRISEFFGLGLTQPYLDFVDVDIEGDVRYYIDPTARWLRLCSAPSRSAPLAQAI